MAEKRMFAKSIVLSDAFLDMPFSARCLYFALSMSADDDGFVGNPKSIMRQSGCSLDDINILLSKRYILTFPSEVIVIKHWKINNYIQSDRHHGTTYTEEKSTLKLDDKGAYTELEKPESDACIQSVYNLYTNCIHSIDKNRIEENSIEENVCAHEKHPYGEFKNVMLSDEEYDKLRSSVTGYENYIEELSSYLLTAAGKKKGYTNHYSVIRNWSRREEKKNQDKAPKIEASYDLSKFGNRQIKYERKNN